LSIKKAHFPFNVSSEGLPSPNSNLKPILSFSKTYSTRFNKFTFENVVLFLSTFLLKIIFYSNKIKFHLSIKTYENILLTKHIFFMNVIQINMINSYSFCNNNININFFILLVMLSLFLFWYNGNSISFKKVFAFFYHVNIFFYFNYFGKIYYYII